MEQSLDQQEEEYLDLSNFASLRRLVQRHGLHFFKFKDRFTDTSSQGSVGLFSKVQEDREGREIGEDSDEILFARDYLLSPYLARLGRSQQDVVVYKIGTETPYLSRHEYSVSMSLFKLAGYLPNFMRPLGLFSGVSVNPFSKAKNPFSRGREKVFSDLALFEFIDTRKTLASLIKRRAYPETNSIINQLLLALLISQNKVKFIHNDLHFENVLVCECMKRTFILYIFPVTVGGTQRVSYAVVPTSGVFPVVIDYGFSFTEDLNGGPLYTGIHHNNKGYMNYRFDEFTDIKTIFTRLTYNGYTFGREDSGDFRDYVQKELIKKLPIDYQTGWDESREDSVSKKLLKYIKPFIADFLKTREVCEWETTEKPNYLFKELKYEFLDVLCSVVILPLRKKSFANLSEHLNTFLTEWLKVENWVKSPSDKLFILTKIVDKVREDLLSSDTFSESQIIKFQRAVIETVDKVGKKIVLRGLNYRELYLSILNLSECLEGFSYQESERCVTRKTREYSKLRAQSSFDLYRQIEPFITETYTVQRGDFFVVLNACQETSSSFVVRDRLAQTINNLPSEQRAEFLANSLK